MTIWPLFSFLRSFGNVWGLFCIIWGLFGIIWGLFGIIWGVFLNFFRGKTVGLFLYFLRGFLYFLGQKKWGRFCIF
jgi:hypothetical protein